MEKAIYFDMDGTIADFYSVDGWLDSLMAKHTKPYRNAKPLVNMRKLSKILQKLQADGYAIGIISWGCKNTPATDEYFMRICDAKNAWLKRHLGSVCFDVIHIVEYGAPKYEYANADTFAVLFDDEKPNRDAWNAQGFSAYDEKNILEILEKLLDN